MFRRQYCAIFRELTVPDQICYTNVMAAKTGGSESRWILLVNEHPLSLLPVLAAMKLVQQIWSGTVSSLKMAQYWRRNMQERQ
jgi:hypothetical protein